LSKTASLKILKIGSVSSCDCGIAEQALYEMYQFSQLSAEYKLLSCVVFFICLQASAFKRQTAVSYYVARI